MAKLCTTSFGVLWVVIVLQLCMCGAVQLELTPEEQLFGWVRSYGGRISGLTLMTQSNGMRGLFTTNDFTEGSIMLVIPMEVIIHRGSALNITVNSKFVRFFQMLTPAIATPLEDKVILSLYLMFEKFYNRKDSIISPYLANLPEYDDFLHHLPRFWEASNIDLFETLKSGYRDWIDFTRAYKGQEHFAKSSIYPVVAGHYGASDSERVVAQYVWASTIVNTRSWSSFPDTNARFEWLNPVGSVMLVPIAEMLNHRSYSPGLSSVMNRTVDGGPYSVGYGVQAEKHHTAGDEIFLSYSPEDGHLSNIKLFILHGFVDPSPYYDCFTLHIVIRLAHMTSFAAEKKDLLKLFGIATGAEGTDFLLRGSTLQGAETQFPKHLMVAFRILSVGSLADYERGQSLALQEGDEKYENPWTITNEFHATKLLLQKVHVLDKQYSTTVAEDQVLEDQTGEMLSQDDAALKKLGVSRESIRRKKKIIELRRREHQVLHANSQVIERKWVSLLSSNARTF